MTKYRRLDIDLEDPAELRRQAAIARLGGPIVKWSSVAKEAPAAWFRGHGLALLTSMSSEQWIDDFIETDGRYIEYRQNLRGVLSLERDRARGRFRATWNDFIALSPRFVAVVSKVAAGAVDPATREEAKTLMDRLGHDSVGRFFVEHAASAMLGASEAVIPGRLIGDNPPPVEAAAEHTNQLIMEPEEPR